MLCDIYVYCIEVRSSIFLAVLGVTGEHYLEPGRCLSGFFDVGVVWLPNSSAIAKVNKTSPDSGLLNLVALSDSLWWRRYIMVDFVNREACMFTMTLVLVYCSVLDWVYCSS